MINFRKITEDNFEDIINMKKHKKVTIIILG